MENGKSVPIQENEVEQKTGFDIIFGLSIPGRIIITLYTFHGLFFIYSFVIQYIILIPSLLYLVELNTTLKIITAFFYLIFAISSSNILVIPSFEFLSFPFLLNRNPFYHFISFKYINKGNEYKNLEEKDFCINIILIIFEIIYLCSLIAGYVFNEIGFKDRVKRIIIILIYFYYLTIVLLYFFTSLYLIIKNIKKLEYRKNLKEKYEKKDDIPKENLMSYLINPILFKFYRKNNLPINDDSYYFEDFAFDCGFITKFILIILSIISFFFILKKFGSWFSIICFLIFFCIFSTLSFRFKFSFLL